MTALLDAGSYSSASIGSQLRQQLVHLARTDRTALERALAELSDDDVHEALYDWKLWGRPEQQSPAGDWFVWAYIGGRGTGKTRTGAEWTREQIEEHGCRRLALVGRTAADIRDVMIYGESGILAVSRPEFMPVVRKSERQLLWPNGAIATWYAAAEPSQLRGPQHEKAWADEVAAWQYELAWDNLLMGLRLGDSPQAFATTTPRATPLVKAIIADVGNTVTRGSTYDNTANLPAKTLAYLRSKYEGTRLGRQELYAEILDDHPGALWKRAWIDAHRVFESRHLDPADQRARLPRLLRVVVAVDPAVTSGEKSDETGIVTVGLGVDRHVYVLADDSGLYTPNEWGQAVAHAAQRRWDGLAADCIVAETNNGGDLVISNIRAQARSFRVKKIHAKRAKRVRAEPVVALYEQGRVHHLGSLGKLEDQMTEWDPDVSDESPDRLDAAVYGCLEAAQIAA